MLWAVMGFLPWDLRRAVMMGDAGSNRLGAVLGLACVLALPLTARILLVLVLLALNILSERISFSKVIESNPVLSYLDKLGR
jgi:UDP-GlcNAc:undecaprenyl-phosphate GlcNAc-1-phosphate transferase